MFISIQKKKKNLLLLLITVFSLVLLAKPIFLFLYLMYANSNWIDAQKTSQYVWPPAQGMEAQLLQQNLQIY